MQDNIKEKDPIPNTGRIVEFPIGQIGTTPMKPADEIFDCNVPEAKMSGEGPSPNWLTIMERGARNSLDAIARIEAFAERIPNWVPLIKPLIKAQYTKPKMAYALLLGIDPNTKEKIIKWDDRLKAVGNQFVRYLLNESEAAIDAVLLASTFGAGSVTEAGAKASIRETGAKEVATTLKAVAGEQGAETFVELIPSALNTIGKQFESEAVQKAFQAVAKFGRTLLANPVSREAMISAVKGSKPWQEFQSMVKGSTNRVATAEQMINKAADIVGFMKGGNKQQAQAAA